LPQNNNHPYSDGINIITFDRVASFTAGTEIDYTPGRQTRKKLVSLSFLLTTSLTAANRYVHVMLDYAGTSYYIAASPILQDASKSIRYYFTAGEGTQFVTSANNYHANLPDEYLFTYTHKVVTETENIQAADQFTEVTFIFAEQPTGRQL